MGDRPFSVGEECSEEKTEPFSQSEIESRLQNIRGGYMGQPVDSSVSLDDLVVPPDKDIRLLVRPSARRSVSPGTQDNCEWLALRAEVAEHGLSHQKVLAVTQTSCDIKFSVRVPAAEGLECDPPQPPLWCELYYDPNSHNQILVSRSDVPISLSRVSYNPAVEYAVNPNTTKALAPGTWRIKVGGTEVLDFRILEKQPAMLRLPSPPSPPAEEGPEGPSLSGVLNSSGKRSFVADADHGDYGPKKVRATESGGEGGDGVIMFLRPKADPLVFPLPTTERGKELAQSGSHPLLELQRDQSVEIPGVCELDQYQITKREPIASTALSTVFEADHSAIPNQVITVKVLKTRLPAPASGALAKPLDNERNVIRQADIWLREFHSHRNLNHRSIVRLFGGDARCLSLYMENIPAKDLAARGVWREAETDLFGGESLDSRRILFDIANALSYLHERKQVHNDIKPANILYSRDRGAVLCDFGLSTAAGSSSAGGTPYYVPPEFIGRSLRGPPSDVWALGVTMLYVLRKIPFPESRARMQHPRRLYWQIADLNRPPAHLYGAGRAGQGYPSAVDQMRQWLGEIAATRRQLNRGHKMEVLVGLMLAAQPGQRISMRQVLKLVEEQIPER